MQFFLFFTVTIILILILSKILDKLLGKENKKLSDTPAKNIDRWGRGLLLVIYICLLPFISSDTIFKWYLVGFFILLNGFQAFLEWKYLKDTKQYIKTLVYLIFILIMVINMDFLLSLFS